MTESIQLSEETFIPNCESKTAYRANNLVSKPRTSAELIGKSPLRFLIVRQQAFDNKTSCCYNLGLNNLTYAFACRSSSR